jgi:hypothetical protein
VTRSLIVTGKASQRKPGTNLLKNKECTLQACVPAVVVGGTRRLRPLAIGDFP